VSALIEAILLPTAPGPQGQRLALWHRPAGPLRSVVLYAHPFAEEMNKSRRMAALQARALAERGHGVLQIDLLGCGDSAGDFGDARWAAWVDDLLAGARWLRARSDAPMSFWGLRAGCLLLAEAAAQWPERCDYLFWQPTPNGAAVLRQFLRTAAAAALLDGGGKGVVESLRKQLATGAAVEVGGYHVHPALANGLEQARLLPPARPAAVGSVAWFDLGSAAQEAAVGLGAASAAAAAPWQAQASAFEAQVLAGPPFWQTTEIETAPRLIERSTAAVERHARAVSK
jgi:exosortase A-associated hydrolase 2